MKHFFIILPCDYIDSEQISGQIIYTKRCTYPLCGQWMSSHWAGNYLICLHIYTVIVPMHDSFLEYSVNKAFRERQHPSAPRSVNEFIGQQVGNKL